MFDVYGAVSAYRPALHTPNNERSRHGRAAVMRLTPQGEGRQYATQRAHGSRTNPIDG